MKAQSFLHNHSILLNWENEKQSIQPVFKGFSSVFIVNFEEVNFGWA